MRFMGYLKLIQFIQVDAFWCFVGFMEMEERNFEMNQQLMKQQLENFTYSYWE